MGKGRRYDKKQKLNVKKVIAVIITILASLMILIGFFKILGKDSMINEKNVAVKYFTMYSNNKYGVIDSKGNEIIPAKYDELIIIPNSTKDIFFCTENVDYSTGNYETKVIDKNEKEKYQKYDIVEPIQNVDSQNIVKYEEEILRVKKDGKYGVIDYKGNELLECKYQSIEPLRGTTKSILIKYDEKYGLADNAGSIIIKPEFKEIKALNEDYSNGYIVKDENDKYGLIKYTKKRVLDTVYDEIYNVCGNEYYVVKKDGKKQVIDENQEKIFDLSVDQITNINENGIIVEKDGKYGMLDLKGNELIPTKYEDLQYAFSEYYIAKKDGKYGAINLKEEEICEFKYDKLEYRKDENFLEATETDKVESVILDRHFQERLEGIISEINSKDGYMKIRIGNEYKYYNFKFEEKQIKDILSTNEIYLSKKDNKYGFVNKEGLVIVNYIYDDAKELNSYGYAAVKKDGLWGCIDHTGKVIVEPKYKFENNLVIDFIGKWHYGEDINANYYTDEK